MRADTCGPERGGALRGCSPQAVYRGRDPRETWPLAWLLIGLLVAGALGQLVVIFAVLFDDDARVALRRRWALASPWWDALAEDAREAVADWRERRAAR